MGTLPPYNAGFEPKRATAQTRGIGARLHPGTRYRGVMKHALVYITAPNRAAAARLARIAVDGRLAACANMLPRIESVYRWKGRVETATETALILKTRMTLIPRLIAAIRKAHPYECPCIVAVPIAGGNPDFLQWIEAETSPATRPVHPAAARKRPR